MDVYLVGGAVRDALLQRAVVDRDWVVVGATPEAMLADGYTQVGRDFPVFLHPESHEEYALARTERKVGPGHQGFVCHAGVDVTLEDDLERRDLTINALAQDAAGVVVDPFGGQQDLSNKVLRHVSPAFVEDPLRVFRVARFASQLEGFSVAPETQMLMRELARGGELESLSAERVWQELSKGLLASNPQQFFMVLAQTHALAPWLVEFEALFAAASDGAPDRLVSLFVLAVQFPDLESRFALLGLSLEPSAVQNLGARLRAPKKCLQLAGQLHKHRAALANWRHLGAPTLYASLKDLGAFRPESWPHAVVPLVSALDAVDLAPLAELVQQLVQEVSAADFLTQGITGPALGKALDQARVQQIEQWLG